MSLASGRSQKRLLRNISQRARVCRDAPTGLVKLLCEIVEVEALWLAVLVVSNLEVGNGLSLHGSGLGIAGLLALRFTLQFFRTLFLACTFFLPLGERGTRVSCHIV